MVWKSKLATEIALSTTEAEYTALSYALRDAIPLIKLLKEFKKAGYPVTHRQVQVHCKVLRITLEQLRLQERKSSDQEPSTSTPGCIIFVLTLIQKRFLYIQSTQKINVQIS